MSLFLHTLDRKPAYFDGEQLVFAEQLPHWQDDYEVCVLCETIAEVRRQQRVHRAFRQRLGWDTGELGYVEVGRSAARVLRRKAS